MAEAWQSFFENHKQLYNEKLKAHARSPFYRLEAFKNGENVLSPIERSELQDVAGKTLLHLQCHAGLDTLSWAREGAIVTGADFAPEVINRARKVADELDIPATFLCMDLYKLPQYLEDKFDIVFTSFGVLDWLYDLKKWAAVVHHFLKPGGTFYLAEFHPVVWLFDDAFSNLTYSYFHSSDSNPAEPKTESKTWQLNIGNHNHPLSDVINALVGTGLKLEFLHEFPYSPYPCFSQSVPSNCGNWHIKGLENKIPLVYSLKFQKPE